MIDKKNAKIKSLLDKNKELEEEVTQMQKFIISNGLSYMYKQS